MSGPGALCRGPALCVGARRSLHRGPLSGVGVGALALLSQDCLCQVPAVCVSGPGAFCRGLCRSPAVLFRRCLCRGRRSVSGLGALCVGARRSLRRGPSLLVSGPGALCQESASGPAVLQVPCRGPTICVSRPGALCVRARRSVCRGPALFVPGPGALSVGARRSLCRGPARGPALFVSGPGALSIDSGALCQGVCGARTVSVSELGALQRSLCRGPALSARRSVSGPGALCVGARRSLCSLRRGRCSPAVTLCRDPALCVGVCVRAWCRSLHRCFCQLVSRRSLCRGRPALCVRSRGPPSFDPRATQ